MRSAVLANMLHQLSEETSEWRRTFVVPRSGNVNEKKLCAWYAWRLIDEFAAARPTSTPGGQFITVAEFVAELFLGPDEARSMSTSCREVFDKRFPIGGYAPHEAAPAAVPLPPIEPKPGVSWIEARWAHLSPAFREAHNRLQAAMAKPLSPLRGLITSLIEARRK